MDIESKAFQFFVGSKCSCRLWSILPVRNQSRAERQTWVLLLTPLAAVGGVITYAKW